VKEKKIAVNNASQRALCQIVKVVLLFKEGQFTYVFKDVSKNTTSWSTG